MDASGLLSDIWRTLSHVDLTPLLYLWWTAGALVLLVLTSMLYALVLLQRGCPYPFEPTVGECLACGPWASCPSCKMSRGWEP